MLKKFLVIVSFIAVGFVSHNSSADDEMKLDTSNCSNRDHCKKQGGRCSGTKSGYDYQGLCGYAPNTCYLSCLPHKVSTDSSQEQQTPGAE